MATELWLKSHGDLYRRATRHEYIASIHDGSIDLVCYRRWLGQDYIFVKAFVGFIASTLVKLPEGTSDAILMTLLGGAAALHDELKWFQTQASYWKIDLNALTPKPAAEEYCRFLKRSSEPGVDFAVAMATFWAIEDVYCDSFAFCLEPGAQTPAEVLEGCKRWGSSEFKSYCNSLKDIVNSSLEKAGARVKEAAEDAFVQVLKLEVEFWNMSTDTSSE